MFYDPNQEISVTIGKMEALALMTVLELGNEVILADSTWPNYEAYILLSGDKPVFVPLKR